MKYSLSILCLIGFVSCLSCNVIVDDPIDDEDVDLDSSEHSSLSGENAVGGRQDLPVDDEDIKRVANAGLKMLVERTEGLSAAKIVSKILNVKKQLADGILYDIEMEIRDADGGKLSSEVCTIALVEKEWLDSIEITSFHGKFSVFGHGIVDRLSFGNFLHFLDKYNKTYTTDERMRRYVIYLNNMKKIRYFQENEQGTAVYGVTEFADLTYSEFKQRHLGFIPNLCSEYITNVEIPDISLPEAFDWRNHDAVTPVKNQGSCGSCYGFSAVGCIEGQYAIKYKKLQSFSEQELIDCDKVDAGCDGGFMNDAFEAVKTLGGIQTEKDYPYKGRTQKCKLNKKRIVAKVTGYVNIPTDETNMAKYLVANGPISVALNAAAMRFYTGGVSHPKPTACDPNGLNHGVLIVGYGIDKSGPYWIIKNSWGVSWGMNGYYLLYRGDGVCGINTWPSSALVA